MSEGRIDKPESGHGLTWRILHGASIIGGLTLMVKMVALVKETQVAAYFGTGDAVEAFRMAILVPSVVISVLSGSMGAALIPTYVRVREREGNAAVGAMFSNVLGWGVLALLAGTAIIYGCSAVFLPWLGSGFDEQKLLATQGLLIGLSPLVLLTGFKWLIVAALHAHKRFAVASLVPSAAPLCLLSLFLVWGDSLGPSILVMGVVIGAAIEVAILMVAARAEGISLRPRFGVPCESLRIVIRQFLPAMAAMMVLSLTTLVDVSMAAMLAPGNVAALAYAEKLIAFPLGIGATAIGGVVMPFFSSLIGSRDFVSVRRELRRQLMFIGIMGSVTVAVIWLFSEPLVSVVLERGAFREAETEKVAQILEFAALQVPFYVGAILMVRLLSSILANRFMLWGNIISVVVNVTLNLLFMKYLGVAGIALSTTCVHAIAFFFLLWAWRRALAQEISA